MGAVFLFLSGILSGIICAKAFSSSTTPLSLSSDYREVRAERSYKYISPLLECEAFSNSSVENMNGLKGELSSIIEDKKAAGDITFAAVYFKDLSSNTWFGINEKEKFSPASLLKVPVLMAYLKQAEQDPNLLDHKLVAQEYDYDLVQNIPPTLPLETNKSYSIEHLLESMIIQSDNNAYLMLTSVINEPTLIQVYKDIGINIQQVSQDNPNADFINVREYATLFRVLYNASYLNDLYSEKALSMLTKTTYRDGLIKYLNGTPVAHKFGERRNLDTGETQLHDCGIVYYPEKPYLICIMTKGKDFQKQAEVIATLSRDTFQKWSKDNN